MDGATAHPLVGIMDDLTGRVTTVRQDRLAGAVLTSVRYLHDLLADLRPSADEWRHVIRFLTDVGHSTDSLRQEWVLLADVLGASAAIEDLNTPRPDGATPNTLAGPFYRADVPALEDGADISRDGVGNPLFVSGRVTSLDKRPVPHAMIEVWQANSDGFYENQQPDVQPEFNLRGRFTADVSGAFTFATVCPRGYSLPEDGPVGRLLNGLGIKLERPAHLHFKVTAPDHQVLTTHVYDRTDPAIGRDALFCVKPTLLGDFRPIATKNGPAHALQVSFVLAPLAMTSNPHTNQHI